jgi:tol-pal system-associated acyl-CoA thioesterase
MKGVELEVRVYLEDTDAQGVVYHASYFRFLERARTEWLRMHGVDHEDLRLKHQSQVVLAAIEARFKAPGRLDEVLCVSAEMVRCGGARVVFAQQVRRGSSAGTVLCEATAEVACVDALHNRPKRLPPMLRD